MHRFMLIVTLLIPMLALAESAIYRTTDANGNVVFTDAPPAGSRKSEVVTIQPINTTPAPEIRELTSVEEGSNAAEKAANLGPDVKITKPRNNETIPLGGGDFSVAVKVKPKLTKTQSLQLFLDGVPWGEPQRSSTWGLSNIFRGEHELTVGMVDATGTSITVSDPVVVFVQRPGLSTDNGRNQNIPNSGPSESQTYNPNSPTFIPPGGQRRY